MAPPPPAAWAAAEDLADAEPLEVRCAGCRETMEVDRGLTEFTCPDCATPQALPPELMPPPPPRRRKALPLPRGAADVRGARLPCGACGALLSVPVGLPRCACPLCGAGLAVDTARLRNHLLSSSAAADAVPVLPLGASSSVPPILQAREAQTDHPNRPIPVQAESEHPDYTVDEEEVRVNEDTARYREQRNIYSGGPRIVRAENRHGEPLNQVRHQAQDLPSSHAVRTKQTYQESPDRVTDALRKSSNPALFRESGCISHINDTTTTDINGTDGRFICPKTVNLEKRNMHTPKQVMQKPQRQLPCNVTSLEHARAESSNRAIHVQKEQQEPGNEANHRENACTRLGDETIADNNNRRTTRQLIGLNAMGAEKRQGLPNDATHQMREEQSDSMICRELDNQVTRVENEQPGHHRVHTRKRKGVMAASNSGVQLRRIRRLAKVSSTAIDRQPVIDDKVTESEPNEQWTASPGQRSPDPSDTDKTINNLSTSSSPLHEIRQTNSNELENLHSTSLQEIQSDSSTKSDDNIPISRHQGKRKAVAKVPQRARGRGKLMPTREGSSQGSGRRSKNASAAASPQGSNYYDNESISLEALQGFSLGMTRPRRPPRPGYNVMQMVDYKKGSHDIRAIRSDRPSNYVKQHYGDVRFWLQFHADWYESVILSKSNPITEMKSIDWSCLQAIKLPVCQEVIDACRAKHLMEIMSFTCDWNEEVVAQFYATLYIDKDNKVMHWTTEGKPLSVTYNAFAQILGFNGADLNRHNIHDENILEDGKMHFMYDSAYGAIEHGKVKGLTPYYRLLNQLFRYTLCPKSGDSDNIANMAKNLLARMAPDSGSFSVFDFIWDEIIICSCSPLKGCHYAPYIFFMIKEVTQLQIMTNKGHPRYRPKIGHIERLCKIGKQAIRAPQGQSRGASSSQGPSHAASPSQRPSTSRGPPSSHGSQKKGTLNFIAQGLFACFNICRHNADEIHEQKKLILMIEKRQKEFMDEYAIPHSPIEDPDDLPSPSVFYNPWEEYGQPSMYFGASQVEEEEDLGGCEEGEDDDGDEDNGNDNYKDDDK